MNPSVATRCTLSWGGSKWLHAEARDQVPESSSGNREPRKSGKISHNTPQSEPLPSEATLKGTEQLSYSETNFKSQGDTSRSESAHVHKSIEMCGTSNPHKVVIHELCYFHFEACSGMFAVFSCDHPFLNISASAFCTLSPEGGGVCSPVPFQGRNHRIETPHLMAGTWDLSSSTKD